MDISERKITKIAREVNKFTVKTLKKEGIGTSELDTLHIIRKNPGITQSGICSITGIDKAAIARQIGNLESKGYVIRKENNQDKRSQLLSATKAADNLKNSKANIESIFYSWLLEDLSKDEQVQFVEILNKLYLRCKEESKAGFSTLEQLT